MFKTKTLNVFFSVEKTQRDWKNKKPQKVNVWSSLLKYGMDAPEPDLEWELEMATTSYMLGPALLQKLEKM